MVLVIPGGIKKVEAPKLQQAPTKKQILAQTSKIKKPIAKTTKTAKAYTIAKYADTEEEVESGGRYSLTKRKAQHTFYWGNCTWFVAQYKNVNW